MKRFVMFKIGEFTARGVLETPSIAVRNWYQNNSNFSISYNLITNSAMFNKPGFNEDQIYNNNPIITITVGEEYKRLRVLNVQEAGNNRVRLEVGL